MSKKKEKEADNILTPKRTVKFFFISWGISSVVGIIIWTLLDLIINLVFTHTTFYFSVDEHIYKPVMTMLILTVVEFLTWNVWHKEK